MLHGGRESSSAPTTPRQVAVLRLVPVARRLARVVPDDVAVWRLRNRRRGWNGEAVSVADPVADARWALAEIERRHGPVPVVVVGHSMGGRVALRLGADPTVQAIVALAPWVKPEDSPSDIAGTRLLVLHGLRDRTTDPAASRAFVDAARRLGATATWVGIPRSGHAMVRRVRQWRRFTAEFVCAAIGGGG